MTHCTMSECSYHRATSRSCLGRKEMLFDVRHTVKHHSDSEKGNLLLSLHGLIFPISSWESFTLLHAHSHRQHSTYHSLCYTRCGALAGMIYSLMGPPCGINLEFVGHRNSPQFITTSPLMYVTNGIQEFVKYCIEHLAHLDL